MSKPTPSIAIIAGEASGDLHGAMLASRLRERIPLVRIWGVGGRKMQEAGVQVLHDSSTWSAIGAVEALRLVPRLLLIQSRLVKELKSDPPDLLVLIDFGAFNIRLARRVRQTGMKALYYFPPGSWNRGNTYEKLRGLVDAVVTPFPWSAETLKQKGFRAEFFGHPVLDTAKPTLSYEGFRMECGGSTPLSDLPTTGVVGRSDDWDGERSQPIVGLLPGSRAQEMRYNLPAMLLAAGRLIETMPDLQFAVPIAPTMDIRAVADGLKAVPWLDVLCGEPVDSAGGRPLPIARAVDALARREGFPQPKGPVRVHLLAGMAQDVLAYSRAAVVCSGTATLEAAALGCPMVIIYRSSKLTWLEYRLLGKEIKFVGMPNIIADDQVCPELIYDEASPARIAQLMEGLIQDTHEREAIIDGLAEVRDALGSPGAADRTAGLVLEMLGDG